jgi:hypothetical protein
VVKKKLRVKLRTLCGCERWATDDDNLGEDTKELIVQLVYTMRQWANNEVPLDLDTPRPRRTFRFVKRAKDQQTGEIYRLFTEQ